MAIAAPAPFDILNMPTLSHQQVSDNYHHGYDLALELIREQSSGFGLELPDELAEIAQSVFGCEQLVRLIQTTPFDRATYEPIIRAEIARLSKTLFPDVGKRHFISIDKLRDEYDVEFESAPDELISPEPAVSEHEVLRYLQGRIHPDNYTYLQRLFDTGSESREFAWNDKIFHLIDQSIPYLEEKLAYMRKLYPQGLPPGMQEIRTDEPLSEESIVECYKNVFLGLRKRFPVNFLTHQTLFRCAVMTRFAVERILERDPLTVVRECTAEQFSTVGLRSVVRYFNYSVNRMMRNAYPGLLLPWEESHVEDGFWSDVHNRRMAVRWLVEEKLAIPREELVAAIRDDRIKKNHFLDHGLSYMFAMYYKSVSRAVGDTYPHLMPWELGSVPNSFWQGEEGHKNVARAIQWMIRQLQIPIHLVPARIKDKTICRETFQRFGLSTVFERVFKKNMYLTINAAFPGLFEIWEVGKVPSEYWDDMMKAYRAALWVSQKERVPIHDIPKAIRTRRLRKDTFARYGLNSLLRNVFEDDLWKAFLPYILPNREHVDILMKDVVLLAVLQKDMRNIESTNALVRIFRNLFFKPLLSEVERQQLRLYKRIKKRIRHRIGEMTRLVMPES